MSALSNSGHTSSTLAAFPGFVLFNASLTSCNGHLPRSISLISSNSTISSSSTVFVRSFLFNISLKCPTHLCSPSLASVLSTPCLSLTPISCLRLSPVIDSVMLYTPCSYNSQRPFPLLQPPSLTNFSYPPSLAVSLRCSSHYTPPSISVSVVPISNFNFDSFLSLIFSNVLLPIHGLLCFFDLPTTFFAASLYVAKIMWCSSSGSSVSPKASNLFLISVLYLLLISLLCSLLTSNLSLTFFLPSAVPNFRRILV